MKRLLIGLLALALLAAGRIAYAQDVTGAWQGTLEAGRALRIVITITKGDGGAMQAVMYSIDQGGQGIPAAIAVQGGNIKVDVAAAGVTFQGKLSSDGGAISGTFAQGGGSLPLNLVRATGDTAWAIPEPPAAPKPMAANARAVFEVATIKPSKPETQAKAILVRGRQLSTLNTSVSDLIAFAYGLQARQVTNGPAWLDTDKYNLLARPDGDGQPNEAQWKTMLQQLLADRFRLAFHRDKKELPVYAIVVARSGPKLTKSQGDPNGLPSLFFRGLGTLPASNASMADLASTLQNAVLDRPVVDRTGLSGRYDFALTWTPDEFQFGGVARVPPPSDAAAAPNLFTAIQEQLGLRLDSTRAPADVIVIDRLEKPSEN